ncbi:hypothetical protein AB0L40_14575 [Patulibacter sp. NPDC049589]
MSAATTNDDREQACPAPAPSRACTPGAATTTTSVTTTCPARHEDFR